ncbi:hypothetical protein GQ43DRAFT_200118 [Delitschia confertaspora ATCC 74209]|uniref:Uncharacterized protein n=1 Tax=Delitschia confertaspora ATCC 74209 TaxID=1513339 RepID=A0A9P4JEA8_9PLEO|nr:hypothetical protein GQ43DRAFT_200118 [Delitschia confertaspora ATCC 74209]
MQSAHHHRDGYGSRWQRHVVGDAKGGRSHLYQQHYLYGPKGRRRMSVCLECGWQRHCGRLKEQIRYPEIVGLLIMELLPEEGKTMVRGLEREWWQEMVMITDTYGRVVGYCAQRRGSSMHNLLLRKFGGRSQVYFFKSDNDHLKQVLVICCSKTLCVILVAGLEVKLRQSSATAISVL